jgi:hypothetical protein
MAPDQRDDAPQPEVILTDDPPEGQNGLLKPKRVERLNGTGWQLCETTFYW